MATVFGLEICDIPDGWQPLRAIVIVELIDMSNEEQPKILTVRNTHDLTTWEAIGMLRSMLLDAEKQFLSESDYGEEEEDE